MGRPINKMEELLSNMTPKQQVFCTTYMKTNDLGKAFSAAYKSKNEAYSRKRGNELISTQPEIMAFFEHQQAQLAKKYQMPIQIVIEKHMLIVKSYEELLALVDRTDTLSPEDNLKLQNLKDIVKTSDYRNALIEISKLKQQYVNTLDFTNTSKIIRIELSDRAPEDVEYEDVQDLRLEPQGEQPETEDFTNDDDTNGDADDYLLF